MEKISRKGFLKIAAAAAMGGVTAGALAACQSASTSASSSAASGAGSVAAGATYIPGTYEGTAEGISSTVKVTMTFSDSAVTDVVVDTSGETASYGAAAAEELQKQLLAAGSADIDGVSGSTITSQAVMKAAKSCISQAMGETVVTAVQLPTGDENDWLGTEPDIDEAAITDTWDTDILIVGAGNGGMCAAAFAAKNGLNFRIIEQNGAVMETRGWYGAIDSSEAQKQGVAPVDRAELLSEISRTMGGRCDQRVVKTWIDESAAMHDFVASILESDPYNYTCNLTSGDEAKWPDDTQVSQTKLMFPVQQIDYSTAEKPRNEVFQEYIEGLGYSIDFNTALAKLEKDDTGRITGAIAQSNDDGHFIRINASKGVLLACGGYAGNPYMMEQLDPLGTSVTTACSYAPADKGYGIRAAIWAGAHLDAEPAPVLFDRGLVAPGVDSGYVESASSFGGKAFPGTVGQYNPGSQPFLKVNRHGERFMNESQEYDNASHASFQQPGHVYAMIHDANFRHDPRRQLHGGCGAVPHHRLLGHDPYVPRHDGEPAGAVRAGRPDHEGRHHRGAGRQAGLHRHRQGHFHRHRGPLQRAVRQAARRRLRQARQPSERHQDRSLLRLLAGRLPAVQHAGHHHHPQLRGQGRQQRSHPRPVRHRRYVRQLLCQQLPLRHGRHCLRPYHDLRHQGHQADGRH